MSQSRSVSNKNLWFYLSLILCLLGFLACCQIINQIFDITLNSNIPFDTDEADHANAGLELYWHATQGTFSSFVSAFTAQGFYPPLHGIIVGISYKIMGLSLFSSRVSSIAFLLLSIIILFCSTIKASKIKFASFDSFFVAVTYFLLLTTNDIFIENSSLCMLEMQGVFICCLILFVSTFPISTKTCLLISVLSFILFLTKYNFGIFIIPAILLSYLITNKHLAILFSIITTGLISAWLLVTNFDSFKYFLAGHPSYAPILSSENIFFEIKSWVFEYHSSALLGVLITVLASTTFIKAKKTFTDWVCLFGIGSTFFILLLSTTNESRHFIIAAPLTWFIAISFLVRITNPAPINHALKVCTILIMLAGATLLQKDVKKIIISGMEGHPTYDQAILFLAKRVDINLPTIVIGNHDRISIEAVQWYSAREQNQPYSKMKFDSYPFDPEKVANAIKRGRNSDDWYSGTVIVSDLTTLINAGYYKQVIIFRRIGVQDEKAKLIKFFTDLPNKSSIERKIFGPYEAIYIRL